MNLFETLKHFKSIEPDPHYSDKSKRMILALPQNVLEERRVMAGFWGVLETGIAVVLAGLFIILITGIFPGASYLTPVQYSVIDPQGLHAEAQAIDLQIELANLNYPETTPSAAATGVVPKNAAGITRPKTSAPMSATTATDTASSTGSSTLSMEAALEKLAQ